MGSIISRKQAAGQIRKTLETFYMFSRSVPGEGATGEKNSPGLERFFILCERLNENIQKKEYDAVLDSLDTESFRAFYHTVGILAESYDLHNAKYFKENEPAGIIGEDGDTNSNLCHYTGNSPIKYNDPNKIEDYSIIKMGGYKLRNTKLFDYIVDRVTDSGLMGKEYSTDSDNPYVCTTFVDEVLGLLGVEKETYLPGGQRVVDTIISLGDAIIKAGERNPSEGTYIFYYDYGYGTGHTGFVNFDSKGNTKILHNGSDVNGNQCVNLRTRDSRNFKTWFGKTNNGTLYYKKLECDLWLE